MFRLLTTVLVLCLSMAVGRADDPATQPASAPVIVDATDKEAVTKALNTDCTLEGVIRSAEWSATGKVMNIEFSGNESSQARAVIFVNKRTEMDSAFGGDVAKALAGAKVRLTGNLRPSNAKSAQLKGRPEIILSKTSQITILEPATSQPAR